MSFVINASTLTRFVGWRGVRPAKSLRCFSMLDARESRREVFCVRVAP